MGLPPPPRQGVRRELAPPGPATLRGEFPPSNGRRPARAVSRAGGESRGNTSPPKHLVGAMDYGRPIQFGYFVLPDSTRPLRPMELALRAEELGIDLIGVQHHPYQP